MYFSNSWPFFINFLFKHPKMFIVFLSLDICHGILNKISFVIHYRLSHSGFHCQLEIWHKHLATFWIIHKDWSLHVPICWYKYLHINSINIFSILIYNLTISMNRKSLPYTAHSLQTTGHEMDIISFQFLAWST